MFCKRCGAHIEDNEKKCSYCGTIVDRPKQPRNNVSQIQNKDLPEDKSDRRERGCLFIVLLGVIFLIVFIIVILSAGK